MMAKKIREGSGHGCIDEGLNDVNRGEGDSKGQKIVKLTEGGREEENVGVIGRVEGKSV